MAITSSPDLRSASRRRFLFAAAAGGATALVAACGPANEPRAAFQGTDITGAAWGRGFDLTDHIGTRRALRDFKGKVVLLFFGYSNCPGPCPTALAEMAQVVKQVGADRVQGLFVTVDPERDTLERLTAYVPAFHPSFLGLRGTREELEKVKQEFKIYSSAQKQDDGSHSGHGAGPAEYMVDHSTGIYIFDPQGRARLYYSANGRSVEAMVHDIKLLQDPGRT
jgi:protein SCO1/2